ncbi:penicillin acylase family protein [Microbacterium sp. P5_E9]
MTNVYTSPIPLPEPPRPRRRVGRIVGLSLFGLVAGILVIAVIAAGVGVWTIQRSFPQVAGSITLDGVDSQVTVQRDSLGVPTITARGTHDLFFAQGYVHAQDRFWEMDFRRHVTSGRLSELFGASQLPTDRFLRTLGWRAVAEQEVEALDPTVRAYYDAYAEGVNAYLKGHDGAEVSLEYAVLGPQNPEYEIEPWTPADSVSWLKAMAWDLRDNIESETDRALMAPNFTPDQLAELYPGYPFDVNPVIVPTITTALPAGFDDGTDAAPGTAATAAIEWTEVDDVIEAVSALVGGAGEGVGSNSWVVSGSMTQSGKPLLANDPHLGASLPSVWHQIGLRCAVVTPECPFNAAGFGFSGVPGVIIGHNGRVAWGFTNLSTDVTDLYVERLDGDSYWRDGALVPLDVRTETISVAGGAAEQLEIRSTVHGPIVSGLTDDFTAIADDPYTNVDGTVSVPASPPDGEYAVALQWTALQPGTTASAIFALDIASDFEGFRAAAARFDVPAQNLIYADVDGNIGYQTPGKLPIRGAGDGWMPQPGWDSSYDWTGFIPFEELPTSYNPPEGWLVTANNAIVGAEYPHFLTRDWDYGWRAARITDLLQRAAVQGPLTVDAMRDIQADDEFWMGRRLVAVYEDVTTGDAGTDAALDLLRSWDLHNEPDSAAAAYANVLWDELVANLFVRGREHAAALAGQGRLFLVVDELLGNPDSEWWNNPGLDVTGQQEMLERTAEGAFQRLSTLQGDTPGRWNWGALHALPLRSGTFGESGIAPIEWLFNRGPFPVGGGSSVVDATGWTLGDGFETVTVPSMRMIVDLADLDASLWNQLTGESGHAFHEHYTDQTEAWQRVELTPWPFTGRAIDSATTDTLTLVPPD